MNPVEGASIPNNPLLAAHPPEDGNCPFLSLPEKALLECMTYLQPHEIIQASAVSEQCNNVMPLVGYKISSPLSSVELPQSYREFLRRNDLEDFLHFNEVEYRRKLAHLLLKTGPDERVEEAVIAKTHPYIDWHIA